MLNRLFDENIAKKMLSKCRDELDLDSFQNKPDNQVVAVIGGQPGAGKSSITQLIKHKYDNNIVILNGDDFKATYPNYRKMLEQDPDGTAEIVQPYSNYVVNNLKQELMDKQLNVMVEGTMRSPKAPLDTAEEFSKKNYKAEAFVISVNYYASRVGCIERFEKDKCLNGIGRSVKSESHDEAYNQIPETLKKLVGSNQFDNITIFDRNGQPLAEMSKGDDIVKVYTEYRNKISQEQYQAIMKSIEVTRQLKLNRESPKHELDELDDIKKSLNIEFTKQQTESIDAQIREMLKFGASSLTTGDSQKISTLIDSIHDVKAVALPDGNVMLNQSAKVAIADFIGLESARHNVMSDWNGQTDNQLKSELWAKANVLLGELQKSAELNKAKLNEALPIKLSFMEQSQFKGQGNNLQNIYENLTHKGSNVISMNDYKQVVNQMNTRAQSANLSQALTMSKGVKR